MFFCTSPSSIPAAPNFFILQAVVHVGGCVFDSHGFLLSRWGTLYKTPKGEGILQELRKKLRNFQFWVCRPGALPLGLAAARSRHGSDCHRQSFTTVSPLRYPTRTLFENILVPLGANSPAAKFARVLDSPKLKKTLINNPFLKVLEESPERNFF